MVNFFWIELKKDGADKLLVHEDYFPQKYKLAEVNCPKPPIFINICPELIPAQQLMAA